MTIQELIPLGPKTTMKIGGSARYYAELKTKDDVEEAWKFSREKNVPLIVLGAGANTVFADGTINALIVRITADNLVIQEPDTRNQIPAIHAETGISLATLINRLADHNLDLSALTGIPGTLGGALVGNAGQGPKGIWLDSFVESVTVFDGEWKTLAKAECQFAYRESVFKHWESRSPKSEVRSPILWESTLTLPSRPAAEIKADINALLKKRIETQPHRLTAGSCFKAVEGTPAWQLIDKAALKGLKVGGVQISDKHANFLINAGGGTFTDLTALIKTVRGKVPALQGIEMRLIGEDGGIVQL
ncbi:MAG: UDP-N-acetylmuramate dehydrogenase [Candidatus Peribacteraceae bacterium]|jgi:UDP-N-acetylmuramate dehydrogenase